MNIASLYQTLHTHPQFKIAFWAYTGFFSLAVFTSCVILVTYTFLHQWQHAVAAGLIVSMIIPIVILLIWTRVTYVDPKLKYVTLLLSILVIFACGVSLTYVWGLRYPGDRCYHPISKVRLEKYVYRTETNECFENFECMGKPDNCAIWKTDGSFFKCGRFNITTNICR